MNDEEIGDQEIDDDEIDDDEIDDEERHPSTASRAFFAVARGIVVLMAGAVVYQYVIPYTRGVPARLSSLVVTKTGIPAFDQSKSQSGIQDPTQTGLSAVSSAVTKAPRQTGLYSIEWAPTQTSAAGLIAFALPNRSDAAATVSQIEAKQMAASAFSAEGLTRKSSGSLPGVPGGQEAVFVPSKPSAGPSTLTITVMQQGRIVAVAEILAPSNAPTEAESLAAQEYAHLSGVAPHFSLIRTIRPGLASGVWAGGTVLVALLAALGPVGWRRLARARRRRREDELAHQVVVGSQVIYKYRR